MSHAIEVATCAVLLEIAEIDEEFTNEEQQIINNILKKKFSLTDEEVKNLVKLTSEELKQSSDLWRFTHTKARRSKNSFTDKNYDRQYNIGYRAF